jgi:hypothetical protein
MITDDLVKVACVAAGDTIAQGYHARRDGPSKRCAEREMRAALAAALPMIRAEVLEEAAKVANDYADEKLKAYADHGLVDRGHVSAARQLAAAIRAMKGDKP